MANKRKRVPPSRAVAKQLAKGIRVSEFNTAQEILSEMGHLPTNNTEYELFSLLHDGCAGNHDRDYRRFYLFINDYLRDDGCALRIFDVISGPGQTASLQINVFSVKEHDYTDYIDMLAYGETYVLVTTIRRNNSTHMGEM